MVNLFYLVAAFATGFALAVAAYFAAKRRSAYTELSLYEVTDGMLPVDREMLLEIARESRRPDHNIARNAHHHRREVRLNLDSVRDQFHRILINAARPRHWADTDWRIITKNRLEHPADAFPATVRVRRAEWELRRLVRRELIWIWLWNMSGFHKREWGPVPDMQNLRIANVLEAYERLRLAAINLARCYGEAVVAEEIAAAM